MQMVETLINGKYFLLLPEHRAARPEWHSEHGWEKARIEAMLKTIVATDIVFDVGTEEGDISALIAKETCAQMVLFEPNHRVWPCIRAIWEANNLPGPYDFFSGFLSNKTDSNNENTLTYWHSITDEIIPDHGFKQLYESDPVIPQETMDHFCERTKIYPDVITMDIEGAEFEVMKGAEKTLREIKPVVFMSVHPVFMKEHYNQEVGVMLRWMHDIGYKHEVIELDYHELHVKFTAK